MFLRKYESFFIVDPDLPEDAYQNVGEKMRGVVESGGGMVLSYTPWGKKKLAYPVKKKNYGYYVLMEFASGPELINELERNMRLDERVLKFITVKLDDKFDPQAVETESQQPAESEETASEAERIETPEKAEEEESSEASGDEAPVEAAEPEEAEETKSEDQA